MTTLTNVPFDAIPEPVLREILSNVLKDVSVPISTRAGATSRVVRSYLGLLRVGKAFAKVAEGVMFREVRITSIEQWNKIFDPKTGGFVLHKDKLGLVKKVVIDIAPPASKKAIRRKNEQNAKNKRPLTKPRNSYERFSHPMPSSGVINSNGVELVILNCPKEKLRPLFEDGLRGVKLGKLTLASNKLGPGLKRHPGTQPHSWILASEHFFAVEGPRPLDQTDILTSPHILSLVPELTSLSVFHLPLTPPVFRAILTIIDSVADPSNLHLTLAYDPSIIKFMDLNYRPVFDARALMEFLKSLFLSATTRRLQSIRIRHPSGATWGLKDRKFDALGVDSLMGEAGLDKYGNGWFDEDVDVGDDEMDGTMPWENDWGKKEERSERFVGWIGKKVSL